MFERVPTIRYCSVCQCKRMFTPEGDCVVCIGLFSDAWIALAAPSERNLARLHPIASEQTEDLARPLSDKP